MILAVLLQFLTVDTSWSDSSDIIEADSLEDLDADTTGKNVFYDRTKG